VGLTVLDYVETRASRVVAWLTAHGAQRTGP
jgi:hypothetical protein